MSEGTAGISFSGARAQIDAGRLLVALSPITPAQSAATVKRRCNRLGAVVLGATIAALWPERNRFILFYAFNAPDTTVNWRPIRNSTWLCHMVGTWH